MFKQGNYCLYNCQNSKFIHRNVCWVYSELAVLHAQSLGYIASTVGDGKSCKHPLVWPYAFYTRGKSIQSILMACSSVEKNRTNINFRFNVLVFLPGTGNLWYFWYGFRSNKVNFKALTILKTITFYRNKICHYILNIY